ncbi:MAG: hypothetical protein Q9217_002245 [Psora testacea]
MADSDQDYVQDFSDEDVEAHQVTRGSGEGSTGRGLGTRGGGWEVTRTWENVVEGADGTISSTVEGLLEADKRKRLLKDTTPRQRGIIRHLLLVLDLSIAMAEKDLRPTRHLLTLTYTIAFVTEFFEQNPISQLGIIGMRDGLAIRISDISGNPNDHISRLQTLRTEEPKGLPSLQNALEMARGALFHAPAHTTREVLIVYGSLLSSDPGDIHSTITALVNAHITVSVIGLAAQVAICNTLVTRTNPSLTATQTYNIALNEQHYRSLLMAATTPPTTAHQSSAEEANKSTLLMMGFPSRIIDQAPTLCACHSKPTRGGYLCSRCQSKVCSLPTSCPACGLTLILSTHLARSYHHLFPLRNWREVSWSRASSSPSSHKACFGCLTPFPLRPANLDSQRRQSSGTAHDRISLATIRGKPHSRQHPPKKSLMNQSGVSESGRYECETCGSFFCIDCDVFAHEIVHNCPGCQSREAELLARAQEGKGGDDGTADGMEGVENGA